MKIKCFLSSLAWICLSCQNITLAAGIARTIHIYNQFKNITIQVSPGNVTNMSIDRPQIEGQPAPDTKITLAPQAECSYRITDAGSGNLHKAQFKLHLMYQGSARDMGDFTYYHDWHEVSPYFMYNYSTEVVNNSIRFFGIFFQFKAHR